MNLKTQTKLALGSVLAVFAALIIVLSFMLGWTDAPRPWGFLLGFVGGIFAGLGATLVLVGLIEHSSGKHKG
jgi:predicted ABC-type sugar transport system permease subunit